MPTTTAQKSKTPKSSSKSSSSTSSKSSSSKSSSSTPDAIAVLTEDHREVERLFQKFEGLGPRAHKSRESTVAAIIEALSRHAGIEETILYPELRERLPKADDEVLEALEEHHLVKSTLAELERTRSEDERYKAKMTVLIENVRHHVEEEEGELFPKLRSALSDGELEEMGARLVAARSSAPSRPHPHAPDEPPANIVANALAAPLDTASRVASHAAKKVRDVVG